MRRAGEEALPCLECWRSSGARCIVCREIPARNGKEYMHSCKGCLAKVDPETHYMKVAEESDRYLAAMEEEQLWHGMEPALQILWLPKAVEEGLQTYSDHPEYLAPEHCRLCMAEFPRTASERRGDLGRNADAVDFSDMIGSAEASSEAVAFEGEEAVEVTANASSDSARNSTLHAMAFEDASGGVPCDAGATDNASSLPRSALSIKEKWVQKILSGEKVWEIRSQACHKRERIALVQTVVGQLVGDVAIVDCCKLTRAEFEAGERQHCVSASEQREFAKPGRKIYAWCLADPRRYTTPVPCTAGQLWRTLTPTFREAIRAVLPDRASDANAASCAAERMPAVDLSSGCPPGSAASSVTAGPA